MKKYGRIIVMILGILNWQSTLGTKAAQINYQSLGQNGCRKYEDGLLEQWGYSTSSVQNKTIQLPLSFKSTDYVIVLSMSENSSYLQAATISEKRTSYFVACCKAVSGVNVGPSGEPVYWFAIGRWK